MNGEIKCRYFTYLVLIEMNWIYEQFNQNFTGFMTFSENYAHIIYTRTLLRSFPSSSSFTFNFVMITTRRKRTLSRADACVTVSVLPP